MSLDDWRINGQEKYLTGAVLVRRRYRRNPGNSSWEHDHCEFCGAKFMVEDVPDVLHEGYTTADDYHWVCGDCFTDFQQRFGWIVETEPPPRTT